MSKLSVGQLVLVPSLLTLAVTALRLYGELQGWSPSLFSREAGGGGSLIGIVWLGLYPAPVLKRMESASRRFVELTQPARTNSPVAVQGASVQVAP